MIKIKVLQFTSGANLGGTEKNVLLLCQRIDKQKFDIGVASLLDNGPLLEYVAELNIPVFPLKMPHPLDIRVVGRLKKVFNEFKPDIVHMYGLRGNMVGRLTAQLVHSPKIVCGIRSIDNWRKFYHVWMDRWTSGSVDLFISNSEAGKKAFVEREHFPQDKIRVIHNGIDLKQYDYQQNPTAILERYHWSENSPIIGHIAHLWPLKGHKILLSILPGLVKRFPRIKVVCLGRDYMNGELARIAQKLNVSNHIEFMGFHPRVEEFIPAFDFCILPSDYEGFPTSILESMAMAKPVIASSVGGIPELIQDKITGLLIPPQNPSALFNAIVELSSNLDMAKNIGLAARKRVQENFSLDKMVIQIQDIYTRLLSA